MLRRLAIILVLLLIGAALNLGVAWALAAQPYTGRGTGMVAADARARIDAAFPGAPNLLASFTVGSEFESPGRRTVLCLAPQDGTPRTNVMLQETTAGWPLPAVEGRLHFDGRRETLHHAFRLQTSGGGPERLIPLRPQHWGFAVNTIVWGLVAWLAALVVRRGVGHLLRRRHRIRRGLCPRCGYPVGRSPVCTECGTGVRRPGTETDAATGP